MNESARNRRSQYRIHHHEFVTKDDDIRRNMGRTRGVVILAASMMVLEITFGFLSSSMALLAEGWHMASHVGALVITLLAYQFATSSKAHEHFSFGSGKFIPLGGYTTAIILAIVAILMAVESVGRFFTPEKVAFGEAILITSIGLLVNLVSAFVLGHGHHFHGHDHSHDHNHSEHSHDHVEPDHDAHDHDTHSHKPVADVNIRSAYFHILADALTSILALGALVLGRQLGATWPDAVVGFVGALVILRWSYNLCRETGWELLDGHPKEINRDALQKALEDESTSVLDLHVWKIAPRTHACELVVSSPTAKGPDYYKAKIRNRFLIRHIVVEEVHDDLLPSEKIAEQAGT